MAIIHLTEQNFEKTIKENNLVLVDFWASWCMPCRMLGAELEKLAEEMPTLVIGKVNVDEENELALEYKIRNIPHMFIFKDGKVVNEILGYVSAAEIKEALNV